MSPIKLIAAVRHHKELAHQIAAWEWLQDQLTADQLDEFADLYRSDPTPLRAPDWVAPAMEIIKEFEGLRLNAYKCPAGVWTIGYGTTKLIDRPVREGDKITTEEAEVFLATEVEHYLGPEVLRQIPAAKGWNPERVAALVSFAYNLGTGALQGSTLRRRLNRGDDPDTVVREELPRWVHAGDRVLEGLVRRRQAEIDLFCSGSATLDQPATAAELTPESDWTRRVTPNIQLGEFALWQDARRFQQQHQIDTAAEIAAFLERARAAFGNNPLILTSGYRPPAINAAVGGAAQSEHKYSEPGEGAVDVFIDGVPIADLQRWIDGHWPYSVGLGAHRGFVHVGRRADGKRRRWNY